MHFGYGNGNNLTHILIPGATNIFHILVCQCPTLTVILTNGALTFQEEIQGTYEVFVTVNGKTSWTSTANNMAIWYVPQFKGWAIGTALDIGSNLQGIVDVSKSEWDCPNLVPSSEWYYFNDANWVKANGDIMVQCNKESEGS